MSVLSGLSKADFKTAGDGLLELPEERLHSIMRTEPITDVYHVEQTPFARSVLNRHTPHLTPSVVRQCQLISIHAVLLKSTRSRYIRS